MTTQKNKTIKQLKQEIFSLGIEIPTKGSGKSGGVIKADLIKLIDRSTKKKEKSKFDKRLASYSMSDLQREMKHLDINKPNKGSGKGGRVVKADLLKLIDEKKEQNKHSILPVGMFFKNMPIELIRKQLIDMDISDVVNMCQINYYTWNTVCNEDFWRSYVISKNYIDHSSLTSEWPEKPPSYSGA